MYFERTIEGLEEALATDKLAASFMDALWAPAGTLKRTKDSETERLLMDLKQRCCDRLDGNSFYKYAVMWYT